MKYLKQFFTLNKIISAKDATYMVLCQMLLAFLIWNYSASVLFPRPTEIFSAMIDLVMNRGIIGEFFTSLSLCFSAMIVAIIISVTLSYLTVIPFFKPLATFTTKLRFLPSVGLTFLFMRLADTLSEQKHYFLEFGVTVFFTTSILSIISSIGRDRYDYAKALGLTEWQITREVVIYGTASSILEAIRQNFAIVWMMLAMAENLSKSTGGIGVVLAEQNKYFHFDYVWAVQILILLTGSGIDFGLRKLRYLLFPQVKFQER